MGLGKGSARRLPPKKGPAIAVAAIALSMATGLANGQAVAPSRVTPSTLAPPVGPAGAITVTSPAGLTPPQNASNLSVAISNVTVEGGFPELEAETEAVTAKLRGRRVTVARRGEIACVTE